MGGQVFFQVAEAPTPAEAFDRARREAQDEFGRRGYTGSLAEKHAFVVIDPPAGTADPRAYAEQLIDDCDKRIDDKWGPAGCIRLRAAKGRKPAQWLFFGWASS